MAKVLFITEAYLKEYSIINDNADMKVLTPIIELVQDQQIHQILGTGLYNELKTQVEADTLTALNITLLEDYVQKAIVWWVMAEAPPVFVYRFMNKGVMKKSSDNSQPADLSEINFLMDRYHNKAEWYSERVTKYLQENSTSYPLYSNPGSGCDTIKPNGTNYTTGMYLGDDSCDEPRKPYSETFQGNGIC